MGNLITSIFFLGSCYLPARDTFQLAPPLLKYESMFFTGSVNLQMKFNQPGAEIRYTTDGREPTTKDLLYKKVLKIRKSYETITARTFAKGLLPSESIAVTFAKEGKQIDSVCFSMPGSRYPGSGSATLNDNRGGITDINSKTWIGYDRDTVEIEVLFNKSQKVNKILLGLLHKTDSWIFLPEKIMLYKFNGTVNSYEPFPEYVDTDIQGAKQGIVLKEVRLHQLLITPKLKIQLVTVKKIPDGYPGKGQHGWLFIDEIKIY